MVEKNKKEEIIDVDADEIHPVVKIFLVDGNIEQYITERFLEFPREARDGTWFEMLYLKEIDKTFFKLEYELVELFSTEELLGKHKYIEYQESETVTMLDLEFIDQEFGIA